MAEENTTVDTTEEETSQAGQSTPEKKYTDEDVNNISAKNSAKAVKKLLAELGIAEDADRAEIKALLEQAQSQQANGGTNEQLQSGI